VCVLRSLFSANMQISVLSFFTALLAGVALAQDHGDHGEHPPAGGATGVPTGNEVGPLPAGFVIAEDLVAGKPLTPGARIVDQKFGPYTLAAGAAKNYFESAPMPCSNCYVVAAQGTLELADGSEANIHNGGWLHHMVMIRRNGVTAGSPTCRSGGGLGGIGGGSSRISMAQMWSTGNERVTKRTNSKHKFGHKIDGTQSGTMTFELMNESKASMTYYMRFRYEVIDFNSPAAAGYQAVATLWLDIGGCSGSNVPAREGVYQIESPVYKLTMGGLLLETSSHLHDGGTHMDVFHNGKKACTSNVLYGRKPGTRETPGGGGHGMLHISDAQLCQNFAQVKTGDEMKVIAYYDAVKYPQMVHGGELHPIMGIMSTFVAPNFSG